MPSHFEYCVCLWMCVWVKSIGYFQEVVALLSLLSFPFNQISESERHRTGHCFLRTHTNTRRYLRSHICKLSLLFHKEEIPSQPTPTGSLLHTSSCGSVSGSVCVSTSGLLLFACSFSLQMLSVAFIEGKEAKEGKDGSRDLAPHALGIKLLKLLSCWNQFAIQQQKENLTLQVIIFYSLQKIKYANVLQLHPKNAADSLHFSIHINFFIITHLSVSFV